MDKTVVITTFENQELDGDGTINLAEKGCAYLLQVSSKLYIVYACIHPVWVNYMHYGVWAVQGIIIVL